MALIEFDRLRKVYEGASAPAVDALDLHIHKGEFITLLGPSGSGKTTTLMLLAGFEAPTSGAIRLEGRPIESLPPHLRGMGVVFQSYSLFPHMTVAQNVAFPLSVRKVPSALARDKVVAALDKVRLGHLADRKPQQLSGGQQQRVALARALVFEPRVVLMDEPLSALDKKLREEMQLEIRRLHRELGVTMVFVTHDQSEAMTLSDRVAVFNHGRIEQLATPQQLYDAPLNPFVAGFVGDNNILRGSAQGSSGMRLDDGRCLQGRATAGLADGAAATLCVRPEHLRVARPGDATDARVNHLPATLVDAIHQGDHWRLVVRLQGADCTWFAKLAPGALPLGVATGQALPLAFDPDQAWLFAA
jgi:putative spermidine/putrescine transport system ATP-binding protein